MVVWFHRDPQRTRRMQEGGPSREIKHQYDCQCRECRDKFGELPLLARVIEDREAQSDRSSSLPSSSSSQGETSSPQPSTSHCDAKKEMTCSHCHKAFTHRGDLNKHLRTHTGEQPFTCEICQRRFAHTSNLSRHLKVHSGDRPFRCDVCNKDFSRKDKLEVHKKSRLCKRYLERK